MECVARLWPPRSVVHTAINRRKSGLPGIQPRRLRATSIRWRCARLYRNRFESICRYQMSKCQTSKTFTGGAVCREFESEAPAAEELLDRVVCSREQFSDVP